MADNPDTSTEAPAPPSGVKALLPALLAVMLGIGGGAALGIFVAGPALTKGMVVVNVGAKGGDHGAGDGEHGDEAATDGEHVTDESGDEEHASDGKKKDPAAAPEIHTLDNLVINPAGSGGSRFLLVTIALEAGSTPALEMLKARDAELRDAVLSTIAQRNVETLTDFAFRDSVKVELTAAINARFGKRTVKRMYFPQWVIQ
ncbi:MAG: flagellar basal body-associated FliL family protein [Gemmatimonadaceae bacterium]|jgi:flagellar FliL protein|nr:flagellar basal body-associated FliL family protein [Gemmatimonadaceae bacterium]